MGGSNQSFGQVAGGVIGGAIGAYYGGPAGFSTGYSMGSTLGGVVDPPSKPGQLSPPPPLRHGESADSSDKKKVADSEEKPVDLSTPSVSIDQKNAPLISDDALKKLLQMYADQQQVGAM